MGDGRISMVVESLPAVDERRGRYASLPPVPAEATGIGSLWHCHLGHVSGLGEGHAPALGVELEKYFHSVN